MTSTAELLRMAYAHMEAGNHHYARAILESLLSVDPTNVEAWEACMQLSESCEDLDYLGEQIIQVTALPSADRESILDYYSFLRERLRISQASVREDMVTLELVDQFTYTLKDQAVQAGETAQVSKMEKSLAWLLHRGIGVLYLVMFGIGFKLLALGQEFGYWILLVLAIAIFISLWNVLLPAESDSQLELPEPPRLEIAEEGAQRPQRWAS